MSNRIAIISSTAMDLPEHREEVMKACLEQGFFPKMMEHLPAADADAIKISLDLVDQADIYIGVFAYRYGYVPAGDEISITEMEYNRAVERGIPRLLFLMHQDHLLKPGAVEVGPGAEKLQKFKGKIKTERVIKEFKSPLDLKAALLNSLSQMDESAGSDLLISNLLSPGRLRPLDGHPVLKQPGSENPVYSEGVRLAFTLSHNGVGKLPILLRGMTLEVLDFLPGEQAEYAHQLTGAEIIGAGVVQPHVFTLGLFGKQTPQAAWMLDQQAGTVLVARHGNLFDTEPPRALGFSASGGDVEEIRGVIVCQEPGFYSVRFVFDYTVGVEDRRMVSPKILLYGQE